MHGWLRILWRPAGTVFVSGIQKASARCPQKAVRQQVIIHLAAAQQEAAHLAVAHQTAARLAVQREAINLADRLEAIHQEMVQIIVTAIHQEIIINRVIPCR